MKDVSTVEQDDSMRRCWYDTFRAEIRKPDHYRNVAVLIIHWAKELDQDLSSWKEAEQLHILFQESFGFHSRIVRLDNTSRRPQLQLDKAITDFVHDNDGPHQTHLLIVFYTGHGYTYVQSPDELIIAGTESGDVSQTGNYYEANANWSNAERPLNGAYADTLVILDCCSAGNAMKGVSDDKRSYELMTATGRNLPTPSPGPKSYTAAFMSCLKVLHGRQEAFTTYDLNQMIVKQRGWNTASQLYNRLSNMRARHIRFAPIAQFDADDTQPLRRAGHLDLRIVFEDRDNLKLEEVQKLASELSGLGRNTGLRISDIEWMGFKDSQNC